MEFKQRLLIAARAVRQYLDYSDKGFIPIRQEDASLKIPLSDLEGSLQSYVNKQARLYYLAENEK